MKKVLMIALMAASVSLTAMAQEQNSQEGRRFDRSEMIQRRTDMMAQRYGLNDNQKMQLLELNKKYDMMSMGPRQGGRPGGRFQGNNGEAKRTLEKVSVSTARDRRLQTMPRLDKDSQEAQGKAWEVDLAGSTRRR